LLRMEQLPFQIPPSQRYWHHRCSCLAGFCVAGSNFNLYFYLQSLLTIRSRSALLQRNEPRFDIG